MPNCALHTYASSCFALHCSSLHQRKAEKTELEKTKGGFDYEVVLAKHHVIGCKASKTKFMGILAVDS